MTRTVTNRTISALALACVAALGLTACSSDGNSISKQANQGSDKNYLAGDGTLAQLSPSQRGKPVTLTGKLLDGKAWSTKDHSGKVIVVNVWGSWCPPCIKEAPALVAAANRTTDTAQFVGLNTRDSGKAQAEAFVRDFKVPYPNLYDPSGELVLSFAGKLPLSSIPSTVLVDAEGRIAARVLGEVTEATLVGLIEDVAAGR